MIIILCVKSDSFLPDKMYSAIFHTCLHALIHIHRSITLHGNSKSPSGQIQQPNCNGLLSQMAQISFHNPIQDQTKANKFRGKTNFLQLTRFFICSKTSKTPGSSSLLYERSSTPSSSQYFKCSMSCTVWSLLWEIWRVCRTFKHAATCAHHFSHHISRASTILTIHYILYTPILKFLTPILKFFLNYIIRT